MALWSDVPTVSDPPAFIESNKFIFLAAMITTFVYGFAALSCALCILAFLSTHLSVEVGWSALVLGAAFLDI